MPSAGVPAESAARRSEASSDGTARASRSRSAAAATSGVRCSRSPNTLQDVEAERGAEDEHADGRPAQEEGDRVTGLVPRARDALDATSGSKTWSPRPAPAARACSRVQPGMTRAGRGTAAAHTTRSRVSTPSAATNGGRPSAVTTGVRMATGHTQPERCWRRGPSGGNDWGVMAYRLRAGDTGPVQQSPVTCGSACLTVARMLVDPLFASWVRTGRPHPPGSPRGATEAERFAAYERVVMRRTNSLFAGGHRPNLRGPGGWAPRRGGPCGSSSTAPPGSGRCTRSRCCAARRARPRRLVRHPRRRRRRGRAGPALRRQRGEPTARRARAAR